MNRQTVVGVLLMLVSVPLIFRLVPRNGLYGFRTPTTLASDAIWYPANQVCGVTMLAAGVVWFVWGTGAGVTAIFVALALSFLSLAFLPR